AGDNSGGRRLAFRETSREFERKCQSGWDLNSSTQLLNCREKAFASKGGQSRDATVLRPTRRYHSRNGVHRRPRESRTCSEVRSQRSEVRSRKSEVRGQRSEVSERQWG